jgi:hypothetical protein
MVLYEGIASDNRQAAGWMRLHRINSCMSGESDQVA